MPQRPTAATRESSTTTRKPTEKPAVKTAAKAAAKPSSKPASKTAAVEATAVSSKVADMAIEKAAAKAALEVKKINHVEPVMQTQAVVERAVTEPAPVKAVAETKKDRAAKSVSADERNQMIAFAAYLRAERRGFAPGQETEDWLAAEAEVDAYLTR